MIMMSIVSLLLFFLGYVDLSWQLMLRVCDEVYFSVPHSLFVSTQIALATFSSHLSLVLCSFIFMLLSVFL